MPCNYLLFQKKLGVAMFLFTSSEESLESQHDISDEMKCT
jgi:hypothetical protein